MLWTRKSFRAAAAVVVCCAGLGPFSATPADTVPDGYTHAWTNAWPPMDGHDHSWHTAGNWIGPGAPNGAGHLVYLYDATTLFEGPTIIDGNTDVTVGKLNVDSERELQIQTGRQLSFSQAIGNPNPELLGDGTIANHGTLQIGDNVTLESNFTGTFTNHGTFHIRPPGDLTQGSRLNVNDSLTVGGTGSMMLNGNPVQIAYEKQLTNGIGHTISGYGEIFGGVENNGVVLANEDGQTLVIDPTGTADNSVGVGDATATFTNLGTLRATSGGTLSYRESGNNPVVFDSNSRVEAFGGNIRFDGEYRQLSGAETGVAEGGMLTADTINLQGGYLWGDGSIAGAGSTADNKVETDVNNTGATISGRGMEITGNYFEMPGARFSVPFGVGGPPPAVGLVVTGEAVIKGHLGFSFNPFLYLVHPDLHFSRTLLETADGTGRFVVPAEGQYLQCGLEFEGIRYLKEDDTEVVGDEHFKRVVIDLYSRIHSADFDGDGDVDGDDYLAWQAGFGTTDGASPGDGDADYDGDVDGDDFLTWQTQFVSSGGGGGSNTIPEPAAITVLLIALAALPVIKRRR